jgi:hypothetical protein
MTRSYNSIVAGVLWSFWVYRLGLNTIVSWTHMDGSISKSQYTRPMNNKSKGTIAA